MRVGAVLVGLLAALGVGSVRAQSFELVAPESLSPGTPGVVTLVNKTQAPLTVRVSTHGFPLKDGAPRYPLTLTALSRPAPEKTGVTSLSVPLDAGGLAYLQLDLDAEAARAAKVTSEGAYLVAFEEAAGLVKPASSTSQQPRVSYKKVQLSLGQAAVLLKPLIKDWTLERTCGKTCDVGPAELPLDVSPDPSKAELPHAILGRLHSDQGDVADVTFSGKDVLAGAKGLKVDFDGVRDIGVYSGNIQVGAESVKVTMNVSRPVWWMLPFLFLGAALFAVQRYLGVYRSLYSFRKKAGELLTLYTEEKTAFDAALANHPHLKPFELEKGLIARLKLLDSRVKADVKKSLKPLDEEDHPSFKDLNQLQELVMGWSEFAEPLVALDNTVSQLKSELNGTGPKSSPSFLMDAPAEPPQLVQAAGLLEARPLDIETYVQLKDAVPKQHAELEKWGQLNARAVVAYRQLGALKEPMATASAEDTKALQQARSDLQNVWLALWGDNYMAALGDGSKPAAILAKAEQTLRKLEAAYIRLEVPGPAKPIGGEDVDNPQPMPAPVKGRVGRRKERETPASVMPFWLRSLPILGLLVLTDALLIVVALVLAFLFHVKQEYLGHVWGYPRDFLSACLTGYGSQGLVAVLNAVVGKQLASSLQDLVQPGK